MGFDTTVQYAPIFWAAVASFVFGFLWYSPALFGKTWMRLNGVKPPKKGKKPEGMGKAMILAFIGSLITAYVIAMLIGPLGITNASYAMKFGFYIWLGFFGSTTLLGSVLWDMKPWGLWLLNSVYWFLNLTLITVILSM